MANRLTGQLVSSGGLVEKDLFQVGVEVEVGLFICIEVEK